MWEVTFYWEAAVVAHGVAPNGNSAIGLALAFTGAVGPVMYKDFPHYWQVFTPKPGELYGVGPVRGRQDCYSFISGNSPSHGSNSGKASVENVNHCLKALRKTIKSEMFSSVALPKPAPGVSGLEGCKAVA